MNVKQVIKKTATYFGRDDIINYIDNSSSQDVAAQTTETVSAMVLLLNMVVSELCSTLVPMVAIEKAQATEKLYYSNLSKKVLDVIAVYDKDGNEIEFNIHPEYAEIDAPCQSVEYKFYPQEYTIDSEIDYQEKDISSSILAYGLAAEFALSEGDFERASAFHKRYIDSVYATKKMRNYVMMQRRWA